MDQAVLVKSDRDIEARVLDALSRVRMPVTLLEWNYVPQLEEWQLILATPWHDSKGPRTTYQALVDALEKAGIYEQVPMRRVFVRSPNDPLVKALVQEAKDQTEGRVYILKHGDGYSLVFPAAIGIVAGGGPIARRSFSSLNATETVLGGRLTSYTKLNRGGLRGNQTKGGRLNISRRVDRPSSQEVWPSLALQSPIAVQRSGISIDQAVLILLWRRGH